MRKRRRLVHERADGAGRATPGLWSAAVPTSGAPPTTCPAIDSPRGSVTPKLVHLAPSGQLSISALHAVPSGPITTSRKSPTLPQRRSPQSPIHSALVAGSFIVEP